MWAHQHYGVVPDIVTFGKKAQVCGLIATARIDEVPN
jgi:L-lysine 6-transaminase